MKVEPENKGGPWRRRVRIWKSSFSASMSNFGDEYQPLSVIWGGFKVFKARAKAMYPKMHHPANLPSPKKGEIHGAFFFNVCKVYPVTNHTRQWIHMAIILAGWCKTNMLLETMVSKKKNSSYPINPPTPPTVQVLACSVFFQDRIITSNFPSVILIGRSEDSEDLRSWNRVRRCWSFSKTKALKVPAEARDSFHTREIL